MHIVLFHFHSHQPNPVYQEISAALRRRGHIVWVGAPNAAGDLEWRDDATVIATTPGPGRDGKTKTTSGIARRLAYLAFMRRVRAFLQATKPDIVQVNPSSMLVWTLPLGMPATTHFVLDIRQINEAVDERLLTKLKEQRDIGIMQMNACFFYEHTCFCHEGAAQKILGSNWRERASIVPVGIDQQFLHHRGLGGGSQRNDKVRFVYVGTLSRLRNLDQVLSAAKTLRSDTDAFQVDLIGPDVAQGYYQRLVQDWGLQSNVKIAPPVPYRAIPDLLQQYDVGLAYVPDRPTWHYQPAIKVLEYRAIGMPILSTDVTTHRAVVQPEVNGLLVQDTPQSIAAGMKRFVQDRAFLQSCRSNAQTMRQGLLWDDVAGLYEDVYWHLLKRVKS